MIELGIDGLGPGTLLGGGGSAVVFSASRATDGEIIAVKVLRLTAADNRTRKQFEREAEAIEHLGAHDGIISILGSGVTDRGEPYLLMPLMVESIQDRLDTDGPIPWASAVELMTTVCDAVDFAHDRSVLHRDVKPANILVDDGGSTVVADFGIAKLIDSTQTMSTHVSATPMYAAPERLEGRAATEQSDVYSLAATLYTMVAGKGPFQTKDTPVDAVIRRVLDEVPAPLDEVRSDVPRWLSDVVSRGLSKDPNRRQASVAEFADALAGPKAIADATARMAGAQALDEVDEVATTTVLSLGEPQASPRIRTWMVTGLLALVTVGLGLWAIFQLQPDDPVSNQATAPAVQTDAPEATAIASAGPTETPTVTATPTPLAPTTTPVSAATPVPSTPEPTVAATAPTNDIVDFVSRVALGFSRDWAADRLGAAEVSEDLADGLIADTFLRERTAVVVVSESNTISAWGLVTCAEDVDLEVFGLQLGKTALFDSPIANYIDYNLGPQGSGMFRTYFANWSGGIGRAVLQRFQLSGANYRCVFDRHHCANGSTTPLAGTQNWYYGEPNGLVFPVDTTGCSVNMVGEVRADVSSVSDSVSAQILLNRLDFAPDRLSG